MSQNDFNLANQGFPSMRADMNSALQALATNSAGATGPSTTYPYQWWYDETSDILKMRNADNDAWIEVFRFDQSTDSWSAVASGGVSGRNLIINGSGRINQRGYVSGAATSGANQFTLDLWFVVTSGQNLTFTGNDAGRTMTAPAGGVSQVIEGANIEGGTYVLNWTGTATATVNGTARAKGDTFTLTANSNVTVRFSSGTFTDVQLEAGSVATPFEWRSIGQELALCQRYFFDSGVSDPLLRFINHSSIARDVSGSFFLPVEMRAKPALSATGDNTDGSPFTTWDDLDVRVDRRTVILRKSGINANGHIDLWRIVASAELIA
jgi:hypothetical protein